MGNPITEAAWSSSSDAFFFSCVDPAGEITTHVSVRARFFREEVIKHSCFIFLVFFATYASSEDTNLGDGSRLVVVDKKERRSREKDAAYDVAFSIPGKQMGQQMART